MTEEQKPPAEQAIRGFEWKDFWAVYIVMVGAIEKGDWETIGKCLFLQQALLAHLAPQAWSEPNSLSRAVFEAHADQTLRCLEALLDDQQDRMDIRQNEQANQEFPAEAQ